jgi:hypothetical protein
MLDVPVALLAERQRLVVEICSPGDESLQKLAY